MADDRWPLAEAKAKLSELVDKALHEGPQRISRNGKRAVVVMAEDAYDAVASRAGGLAALYATPGFLTAEEHDEIFGKVRDRSSVNRSIEL